VVVAVGHHDATILADCARRLEGRPVLFVAVRCPIEVIMARRSAGEAGREGEYAVGSKSEPIPAPVLRWQREVRVPPARYSTMTVARMPLSLWPGTLQ
jgi:chloramphenicol 3-O phosphotransferase